MAIKWRPGLLGVGVLLALVLVLVIALVMLEPQPEPRGPRLDRTTGAPSAVSPPRLRARKAASTESEEATQSGDRARPDERSGWPIAVVDDNGHPVVGATVQICRRSFSMFSGGLVVEAEAEVGEDGFATVPVRGRELAIPAPGAEQPDRAVRFVVSVEPPPDRPDLAWLLYADWPPDQGALRLPPGGAIAGVVVDPVGRPLRDVVATVVVEGRMRKVRTDPIGRFRLAHLPPGGYEVHLAAPGLHEGKGVASGSFPTGTTNAHLTLEAGAVLVVGLSGWEPGDGRDLRVAPSALVEGATVSTVSVHAGVAVVCGLDEATSYTVYLPPGRRGRTAFAEAVRPRAESLALDLEPGVRIAGPIETPEGQYPSRAHVEAKLAGMTVSGTARQGPDGTWLWVVEGLPDREIQVTAWIGSRGNPVARGTVLADAGTPVPLRLLRVR